MAFFSKHETIEDQKVRKIGMSELPRSLLVESNSDCYVTPTLHTLFGEDYWRYTEKVGLKIVKKS